MVLSPCPNHALIYCRPYGSVELVGTMQGTAKSPGKSMASLGDSTSIVYQIFSEDDIHKILTRGITSSCYFCNNCSLIILSDYFTSSKNIIHVSKLYNFFPIINLLCYLTIPLCPTVISSSEVCQNKDNRLLEIFFVSNHFMIVPLKTILHLTNHFSKMPRSTEFYFYSLKS